MKLEIIFLEMKLDIHLESQIKNQATAIASSTESSLETKGLSTRNPAVLLAVLSVLDIFLEVLTPKKLVEELANKR